MSSKKVNYMKKPVTTQAVDVPQDIEEYQENEEYVEELSNEDNEQQQEVS